MKDNQTLQRNNTVRCKRIVDEDHQLLFQSDLTPGP